MAVSNATPFEVLIKAAAQKSGSNNDMVLQTTAYNMLVSEKYDYVAISYPTSTTESYVFKTGGSGGTTVATVTLTYTDSTKANLSSVEKT